MVPAAHVDTEGWDRADARLGPSPSRGRRHHQPGDSWNAAAPRGIFVWFLRFLDASGVQKARATGKSDCTPSGRPHGPHGPRVLSSRGEAIAGASVAPALQPRPRAPAAGATHPACRVGAGAPMPVRSVPGGCTKSPAAVTANWMDWPHGPRCVSSHWFCWTPGADGTAEAEPGASTTPPSARRLLRSFRAHETATRAGCPLPGGSDPGVARLTCHPFYDTWRVTLPDSPRCGLCLLSLPELSTSICLRENPSRSGEPGHSTWPITQPGPADPGATSLTAVRAAPTPGDFSEFLACAGTVLGTCRWPTRARAPV